MHNRSVITNAKFIYQKDLDSLYGKAKYFQYRDTREDHIPQRDATGPRWVNQGLGYSFKSITQRCNSLATDGFKQELVARTLVISPQIDFMAALPPQDRARALAELTENTIDGWFEAMDLPTPEYSYIIHRGESKDERPDGEFKDRAGGEEFMHSHVILAATVPGLERERENYVVYPRHLTPLHQAGREAMADIWTRELGVERVQELNDNLEALTQELAALDQMREQAAIERTTPDERAIAETMQNVRQILGLTTPDLDHDLLPNTPDERAPTPDHDLDF